MKNQINSKIIFTLLLFTAFLLMTGPVPAQNRTDGQEGAEYKGNSTRLSGGYGTEVGVDVGTVFLHAKNHENFQTGIAFGAHMDYFIDDVFALNFSFGYSNNGGKTGFGAMNNTFFDIGPRARMVFDPIAPFISVSPGFVWDKFGTPFNKSAVSFAIDFGTGVDLIVSDHITMGLTYKYHLVFDNNITSGGFSAGTADFQSLMMKINYVF